MRDLIGGDKTEYFDDEGDDKSEQFLKLRDHSRENWRQKAMSSDRIGVTSS